ncbi:MAG: hypothetical protein AAGD06_24325 [Acidobacteriota bacterium]
MLLIQRRLVPYAVGSRYQGLSVSEGGLDIEILDLGVVEGDLNQGRLRVEFVEQRLVRLRVDAVVEDVRFDQLRAFGLEILQALF